MKSLLKNKKACLPVGRGKFIVIDGIDGSGKATQVSLLVKYLKKKGYKVKAIDFPQYGNKSAGLVEEYLGGKYGKPKDINPYIGSLFYAVDRYDASFRINRWLKNGYIVVADRYISSNIGHQGGKLPTREFKKYVKWLYNLEYKMFSIPKPNITIILKTLPEISKKLSLKKVDKKKVKKITGYLKGTKRDIHEKDLEHLTSALNSYLQIVKVFPKDFKVVECIEKDKMFSAKIISQKIINLLKI